MDIKTKVYLIALGVSFVWGVISTIIGLKKKKSDKNLTGSLNITDGLYDCILGGMEKVELLYSQLKKIGIKTADMKLEACLTQVQQYCLAHNIEYKEDVVKSTIEKFIDFSKKVNKGE